MIVIQAPEVVRKAYCERLSVCKDLDKQIGRIIIFVSEAGSIKVCVDCQVGSSSVNILTSKSSKD